VVFHRVESTPVLRKRPMTNEEEVSDEQFWVLMIHKGDQVQQMLIDLMEWSGETEFYKFVTEYIAPLVPRSRPGRNLDPEELVGLLAFAGALKVITAWKEMKDGDE